MAIEELESVGKYWDPNAAMGPPVPPCRWNTGEEMCPCYLDQRRCIGCWGRNVENSYMGEDEPQEGAEVDVDPC